MSSVRRVWTETFIGSYASTSGLALTYLATPLVTRSLGVRTYGTLGAALEWVALFATFLHLSLGQAMVHELSKRRGSASYSTLVGTSLVLTFVLALLGCSILIGMWLGLRGRFFGEIPLVLLVLLLPNLVTQIWYIVSQGFFQALGKVHRFYYLTFTYGALHTLGIVVLLGFLHYGLWAVVAVVVLSGLARTMISIFMLFRAAENRVKFDSTAATRMVRGGLVIHLTAIGYYIFNSSDLLIINHFAGALDVSWYKIAMMIFTAFVLIPAAMTSSLYSLGVRLGPDAAWPAQRRAILQLLGLMTLIAFAAYPFWPQIILLFAGPGFEPAAKLIRILLFGLWGMMTSTLLSSQWILRGLFWQASLLTISVAVINVALDFWAIPKWGAEGAAWVKVFAFGLIALQSLIASIFIFEPRSRAARSSAAVGGG